MIQETAERTQTTLEGKNQTQEVNHMVPAVIEKEKPIVDEERLQRQGKILAILARAADDSQFLAQLADDPAEALREYYTLTPEEIAALASGDIKKLEGWLGKLDQRHATWLWCRLSQEKW